MRASNVITVLSGILFILSGIAVLANIKLPIEIDFTKLIGIAFIAFGVGVLSGASPTSSLTFALSLIILLFSLMPYTSFVPNKGMNEFNVTYKECRTFEANVQMGDLKVMLGKGLNEASGSAIKREIGDCSLYMCCGKGNLTLNDTKVFTISNVLGNVYVKAYKCLEKMDVENYMGNVRITYEVPKNCSGTLTIFTDMGSAEVNLIVPKGVKVEYEISSNLGSYEVMLPNGKGKNEGTYGSGQSVLRVRANINVGSFKLVIGERR